MNTTTISTDEVLDCRDVSPPWPMVRLGRRMRRFRSGTSIELLASDTDTLHDVRTWCVDTGNVLAGFWRHAGTVHIFIRKP